jgi:hypothetical protein
VENIKEVVLEFMKNAPPGPGVNVKLYAVLKVTLKDQLELAREGSIKETNRDLVVDLESTVVEVGEPIAHHLPSTVMTF